MIGGQILCSFFVSDDNIEFLEQKDPPHQSWLSTSLLAKSILHSSMSGPSGLWESGNNPKSHRGNNRIGFPRVFRAIVHEGKWEMVLIRAKPSFRIPRSMRISGYKTLGPKPLISEKCSKRWLACGTLAPSNRATFSHSLNLLQLMTVNLSLPPKNANSN
ncbi:hypothetical protein Tco_1311168 [Tanacetum coccineum]